MMKSPRSPLIEKAKERRTTTGRPGSIVHMDGKLYRSYAVYSILISDHFSIRGGGGIVTMHVCAYIKAPLQCAQTSQLENNLFCSHHNGNLFVSRVP